MTPLADIWTPIAYQGTGVRGTYFEGWYFKMVDPTTQHKLAVIPGVYRHKDRELDHAFIQTLNGTTGQSAYHRFPVEAFSAERGDLNVRIGANRFRADCVHLELETIQGELTFRGLKPWPVTALSPGVMGPFAFVPGMQCYHGVAGFDHAINGCLTWNGQLVDFTGGRGYIEKDWGRAFPRAYVWMQSNHYEREDISLMCSVATIPFAGTWFRGMAVGFWLEGTLYRFMTYTGASIERLFVSHDHVELTFEVGARGVVGGETPYSRYRLALVADRSEGGTLAAPEPVGMIERVVESMTARIHTRLTGITRGTQTVIFEDTGEHAGLEVSGTIEEIAEQG
ncbi:MAG: hypothetical protein GYB64_01850 [Chloroflexi bacterium]|nr:hypothetical protein [Chloroflexota bacterium]